jgi:hypothetical protein
LLMLSRGAPKRASAAYVAFAFAESALMNVSVRATHLVRRQV